MKSNDTTVKEVQALRVDWVGRDTKERGQTRPHIHHDGYCVQVVAQALDSCSRLLALPDDEAQKLGLPKQHQRDPALGKSPYVDGVRPPMSERAEEDGMIASLSSCYHVKVEEVEPAVGKRGTAQPCHVISRAVCLAMLPRLCIET